MLTNYKGRVSPNNEFSSYEYFLRQNSPKHVPEHEETEDVEDLIEICEEIRYRREIERWMKERMIYEKSLEWQVENREMDCWGISDDYEGRIRAIVEKGIIIEKGLDKEVENRKSGYLKRVIEGANEDYSQIICESIKYN